MSKYQIREKKDILQDLCEFNPLAAQPMDRLPHDCYAIQVGGLTEGEHLEALQEMVSGENTSANYQYENQAHYTRTSSEKMEYVLEHVQLAGNPEKIKDQRRNFVVYEDNFNSSLTGIIRSKASYRYLRKTCYRYENRAGVNVDNIMSEHDDRMAKTYGYFLDRKVTADEARAMAFSLSFYTGTKSETCSRGASLIARKGNKEIVGENTVAELSEAAGILYYLVKALSHIPFHWGFVTRACQLTHDEILLYQPGRVITWIQFSSSKKGTEGHDSEAFKDRNVLFKIYSLTGRAISQFSNYPEEEEVLFLPYSTFLVFNRETFSDGVKQVVYMRQVELGLCQQSVLWVDDQIFDPEWENKRHMEDAATQAVNMNVHFIPKSSTDSALSFLRSPFGQRLKNSDKFRIVTDMNRLNENPSHKAGACLIRKLRRMGFYESMFSVHE